MPSNVNVPLLGIHKKNYDKITMIKKNFQDKNNAQLFTITMVFLVLRSVTCANNKRRTCTRTSKQFCQVPSLFPKRHGRHDYKGVIYLKASRTQRGHPFWEIS